MYRRVSSFMRFKRNSQRRRMLRKQRSGGVKCDGCKNSAIFDTDVAVSPKRCHPGPQLLLLTNRKSHACFPLVPRSISLPFLIIWCGRDIYLLHFDLILPQIAQPPIIHPNQFKNAFVENAFLTLMFEPITFKI